jgi:transcriptional regulator with XRE-family HTH domain
VLVTAVLSFVNNKGGRFVIDLGQRIRVIRNNRGLTQNELEKSTGIKREYLSKIENSELKNPTYSTLLKICKGIDISIAELLDPEEFRKPRPEPVISIISANVLRDKSLQNRIDVGEFICIPVVGGEIAAGKPLTINEKDIKDYALVHSHYVKHPTDYDRYRCIWIKKGSRCMSPLIEPGSMVCIDSQQRDPVALDGHIVVMKDDNGDCAILRLKVEQNNLIGIPENIKEYSPVVIPKSKSNYLVGKVVWFRTQIEL